MNLNIKMFFQNRTHFYKKFNPQEKTEMENSLDCEKTQKKLKPQKKMSSFLKSSKAFSLIEILIVLSIIAFVFVFAAQKFSRKEQRISNQFDKLIRLNRRLVTVSKLHNKTYRLAIQLDNKGPEQYWVEKKQTGQTKEKLSKKNQTNEEAEKQTDDFFIDDSFYSQPEILSPLLSVTKVESPVWEKYKTKGLVYIYYYPKGLAQETNIQLLRSDNQATWTLYLDPATKNLQILKK